MKLLRSALLPLLLAAPLAAVANAPPVAEAGPDQSVVEGEAVVLDAGASRDPDGAIVSYLWRFGDGTVARGRTVRRVLRGAGRHLVRLEVADDGAAPATGIDTVVVTIHPEANAPPVADAGGDRVVTVGAPVVFDAGGSHDPDGAILAYRWTLAGAGREGPHLVHAFHEPGPHEVRLEVEDDRGAIGHARLRVIARPAPNLPPRADAGPDRRAAPGEVVRLDAGASVDPDGAVVGWRWSFAGGVSVEGPVAAHAFAAPGRHIARVTVTDDRGAVDTDTVAVIVNAPPTAEAGPDRRSRALRHVFDAGASHDPDGGILRYRWDLGDGTLAEGPRVVHDYPRPGSYTVSLTVTDDSGLANGTATDTAQVVIDAPPIAEAGPIRRAAPGEAVRFDAGLRTEPGLVAVWTFGDGTRLVGRTVEKRFAAPGRHPVRLALRAVEGGPALATDETAVIVNAPPVARAGPDRRAAPGEPVRLDASGSFDPDGAIRRYVWRIGDVTRRSPVPVLDWTFAAPGRHAISLAVIDDSGAPNAEATDELIVSVNAPPEADAGPVRITADRAVTFDAGASRDPDGDPLAYRWAFGDGSTGDGARVDHVYAAPGLYPVTLEVDDGTGFSNALARDATVLRVNAAPVAEAGPNIAACAGNVVSFDARESADPDGDALAYRWLFDDGLALHGAETRRSFEAAGRFAVALTVDDGTGVANALARDRAFVSVDPRPRAKAGPDREVCAGEPVAFDGGLSTDLDGAVNRFLWRFGDGAEADGPTPRHTYTQPGRYRVSLTIEGDPLPRCDNTDVDWTTVTVSPAPRVAIAAPAAAAVGETVTLKALPDLPHDGAEVLSYDWRFEDGETARGRVVSRAFSEPGPQRVALSIAVGGTRAACARAATEHAVTINAPPIAVIEAPAVVAAHRPVRLDASAARDPDGALTAYRWTLSDGARLTGVAPEHVFVGPGTYDIALEVIDDAGLSNSTARATARLEVVAAPNFRIAAPSTACVGEPLDLRPVFSSTPPAARRLAWSLGDGVVSELESVTHIYRSAGAYTVTASLDAAIGGAPVAREASHRLRVNAPPVAEAGASVAVCPGAVVDFDGGRSFDPDGDPLSAVWRFGDGATARGITARHRYDAPGTYRARLEVDDGLGSGCSRAASMRIVHVNGPPVAEAGPTLRAELVDGRALVALDGGASTDPEGRPLRYLWTVDGQAEAEGRRVAVEFDRPGTHQARLLVSDHSGLACGIGSDSVEIIVSRSE